MTPEQKSLLRNALLLQLHDVRPYAASTRTLLLGVAQVGFSGTTAEAIAREMEYLSGKELVERQGDAVSVAVKAWKLTPAGVEHLEEQGLA